MRKKFNEFNRLKAEKEYGDLMREIGATAIIEDRGDSVFFRLNNLDKFKNYLNELAKEAIENEEEYEGYTVEDVVDEWYNRHYYGEDLETYEVSFGWCAIRKENDGTYIVAVNGDDERGNDDTVSILCDLEAYGSDRVLATTIEKVENNNECHDDFLRECLGKQGNEYESDYNDHSDINRFFRNDEDILDFISPEVKAQVTELINNGYVMDIYGEDGDDYLIGLYPTDKTLNNAIVIEVFATSTEKAENYDKQTIEGLKALMTINNNTAILRHLINK
jgi:hypothetical protein